MSEVLTPKPPKTTVFEQIKRQTAEGKEFWSSRDLARVLDYADYRNFEQVIAKAKQASFKSGQRIEDHFVDVTELIDLPKNAQRAIADHMGSTKLAANLSRATQTEEKQRRDGIKGKAAANETHKEVGAKVRQTIKELGGTMPELLPAEESIKAVERRVKNQQQLESGEYSEEGQE